MSSQTNKPNVGESKISAEAEKLEDQKRLDQVANEGGEISWTDKPALRRESRYSHKVEDDLGPWSFA
jgi:hypothetical protein